MINRNFREFFDRFFRLKRSISTKGSFAQDFAFVFSGRAINIISQILFTPLLARIYGPESYGILSVLTALVMNISILSTFRLEGALILAEDDVEFRQLLKTGFLLVLTSTLILLLACFAMQKHLNVLLGFSGVPYIILLLGPFVFINSIYQVTGNWVVRSKEFGKSFKFETPVAVGSRIFNFLYGLFTRGAVHGLLLTDFLLKIVSVLIRMRFILKENFSFLRISLGFARFRAILYKYRQFPMFDMPATWIFTISSQLPIYVMAIRFGNNTVGQVGFAMGLLEVPLTLLANSIAPVFLQRIAEAKRTNEREIKSLIVRLQRKLFMVGLVPFALLAAFGDKAFIFFFGLRWEVAGIYTQCFAVFYLFRLISSPLSSVFLIYFQQRKIFIFHLLLLIARVIAICYGVLILKSAFWSILLYGIVSAIGYLFLSGMIMAFLSVPPYRIVIKSILSVTLLIVVLFAIRHLIF